MAAEAADGAFLHRHQHLVIGCEPPDQVFVERLGKARVRHRRRQTEGGELLGCLEALGHARAERQERHGGALAQDATLADVEDATDLGQVDAETFPARIAHGGRAVVDSGRGRHHVLKLGLIRRRHDDETR